MQFLIAIDVDGVEGLSRAHVVGVLEKALECSTARASLDDAIFSALSANIAAGDILGFDADGGKELKISKFELLDAGSDNLVDLVRDTIKVLHAGVMHIAHAEIHRCKQELAELKESEDL